MRALIGIGIERRYAAVITAIIGRIAVEVQPPHEKSRTAFCSPALFWYTRWDSNPHEVLPSLGPQPSASANSATRAGVGEAL
jgi:hypothetical protein